MPLKLRLTVVRFCCIAIFRAGRHGGMREWSSTCNDADAELPRLIRDGFSQGFPGDQLAEAAGMSVARVYQIRDGRR